MSTERATPGTADWIDLAPAHLARYLFAAQFSPGKRVLDAGTGAGYGAALLQTRADSGGGGAQSIIAVDIDASAISQAQKTFPLKGLTFLVDDCQTLAKVRGMGGGGGRFDLITNFENIEHLPEPEKFLAAALELLAPGGILLTSTPDRASTPPFRNGKPDNPYHFHEWYRDEFAVLLSRHFTRVDMRIQVESYALASRLEAVAALRQGLTWSNPVSAFLFRKIARSNDQRSWKSLLALAAPTSADYPIVAPALAAIYGRPAFHFALCQP